jgi:ABC-type sugar transport system substrate-binding protein
MPRVAFVPCLPPGLHPGMDAVAHGIHQVLARAGLGLRLYPADLRGGQASIAAAQGAAVEAALAHGEQAIILFVLDMLAPERAVAEALARSIPVVAIHKPTYPVSAALLVPNYHQGVVLGQTLARAVAARGRGRRVGVLGGPAILDDIELVRGAVDGCSGSGLELVNDPFLPEYRNLIDVRGGGRRAAERLLADRYPFDGWVVFNDETLPDALAAAAGYDLQLPCVSRNGSPEAIAAVAAGHSTATFDYHLPEIGVLAGETLLDVLASGDVRGDRLVTAPFGELYTAANASRYVPWNQRVLHGELDVAG